MDMILYNTLMGVAAGLILLTLARLMFRATRTREVYIGTGPALVFTTAGAALTFLSGAMAVTWPLTANPPINIAFAEPCLVLGLLSLIGGLVCLSGRPFEREDIRTLELTVGVVGLPLLAIAAAVFRFNLVGDAPSAEPITGQFQGWENGTFGAVYLLAALACFATAARRWALGALGFSVVGLFFLLFSSLNYYTHIGLLINIGTGTDYRW